MANNIVVAIHTAQVTSPKGLPIIIHEGAYWPADDPVVLAYPNSFSGDLRYNLHSSEPLDDRDDLADPSVDYAAAREQREADRKAAEDAAETEAREQAEAEAAAEAERQAAEAQASQPVEQATNAPGEKRTTRKNG